MEVFLHGLFELMFKFKVLTVADNEWAVAIFAVGCALVGLLAVFGDLALYVLKSESLLNLRHGWANTPVVGLAWSIGALVIGYLGQMTNIFQVSLLACATVGTAWPVLFTKILEKTQKPEEEQQSSTEDEK